MRHFLALAAACLAALPAGAQISTDRPGLGFSPQVVGRGVVQIEAGLPQAARESAGRLSLTEFGVPVQLRVGLSDAVELRLDTQVYRWVRVGLDGRSDTDGAFDARQVGVGAKVRVIDADLTLSVLPSLSVPTTEAGSLTVGARVIAGYPVADRLGLTTVFGASVQDVDPDARVTAEAVAVLSASLSDGLSGYAELAAYPSDGTTPAFAGGGLTVLVSPDVQLDASFDLGLNNVATDLLYGVGASVRF